MPGTTNWTPHTRKSNKNHPHKSPQKLGKNRKFRKKMGLKQAAVARQPLSRSELSIPFWIALVMGFPKRYDTSPSANKRQFSPTFRKPGGKKCEKWAFFGSYFEKCRIWRSMRKYKLCTPLDASCQGASFVTLLGCLVGHRAEKTSKNLLKKRVGHFVRSLRSQNAEVAV